MGYGYLVPLWSFLHRFIAHEIRYTMNAINIPRLKLKRAEEHLQELEAALTSFDKLNPCMLIKDVYPNDRRQLFRARFAIEPPPILGIIAGDAVHNMRSALDWLVCQLSLLNGANTLQGVEFPIFEDIPSGRLKQSFEYKIRFLPDEAKQAAEVLQPYHTGHRAELQRLWILQQLDITDKHRGLIVKGMIMFIGLPNIPGLIKNMLNDGTIEVIIPIKDYEFNPKPIAEVAFRAEKLIEPVTPPMLWKIYNLIANGIFPMFTRYFPQ